MKQIVLLISCLLLALGVNAAQKSLSQEQKLRLAEQLIEKYYVEEPDTSRMVEDAIVAMLKTLDPHSTYTNAEETRALTEPLSGGFSGIGIRFQVLNDTLSVTETIAGGPSEQTGIQAGDRIIMCNDTAIAGVNMKQSDIMKRLRGPVGTVANLKVLRRGVAEPIDFRVIRAEIPIYSIDAAYMVDANTGYVKITRFAEETAEEFEKAMNTLRKKGMKNIIIDLTDNGGGYMRPAYEIANMFLPKGTSLVYTDSPKNGRQDYYADRNGQMLDGKIVVMVNQYSASASEILSGALQDNDRAVIVGRRTFGKGLVQRPFPFPDGSMMRLTISRYHTPSGRCIQKPYTSGDDADYSHDIANRLESGELMNADSIHQADSLLYRTLRLNRPVYGGGGIVPDRFVALDTTYFTPYYRNLVAQGIVNRYCFNYVDENRAALKKKYKTVEKFDKGFTVDDALLKGLIDFATNEGVEYNDEQWATSRPYVEGVVKGLIGRDLFDQEAYYRLANHLNPIYREALHVIQTPDEYGSILLP